MDVNTVTRENPSKAASKDCLIEQDVTKEVLMRRSATGHEDSVCAQMMGSKLTSHGGVDLVPGSDVNEHTSDSSSLEKRSGQTQDSASQRETDKIPTQCDEDRMKTKSLKKSVPSSEEIKDRLKNRQEMTRPSPVSNAYRNAQQRLKSPSTASNEKDTERKLEESCGLKVETGKNSKKMFHSTMDPSDRSHAYSQASKKEPQIHQWKETSPELEDEELLNFAGSLPSSFEFSHANRLSAEADQALELYAVLQDSTVSEVVTSLRDALRVGLDSDIMTIVQFVQSELQEMGEWDSLSPKTSHRVRERRNRDVQMPRATKRFGWPSSAALGSPSPEGDLEAIEARGSRRLPTNSPRASFSEDCQGAPLWSTAYGHFPQRRDSDEDERNLHLESRRVGHEALWPFQESMLLPMAKDGTRPKCSQRPLVHRKTSFAELPILRLFSSPFPVEPGHKEQSSTEDKDGGSLFQPESIPLASLQDFKSETVAGDRVQSHAPFSLDKEDMKDDDNDDVITHMGGMEITESPRHQKQILNPFRSPPATLSISVLLENGAGASVANGDANEKDSKGEDNKTGENGEGRRNERDQIPDGGISDNCGSPDGGGGGGGGDDDDNDDDDGDDANDDDENYDRGDEKGGKKRKRRKKTFGEDDSEEEDGDEDEDVTMRESAEINQEVKRTKTDMSNETALYQLLDPMQVIANDTRETAQEDSRQMSETTNISKELFSLDGVSPRNAAKGGSENLEHCSWGSSASVQCRDLPTETGESLVTKTTVVATETCADMDLGHDFTQRYSSTEKSAIIHGSSDEKMDGEFLDDETTAKEVSALATQQASEKYPNILRKTTSEGKSHKLRGKNIRTIVLADVQQHFSMAGAGDMPLSGFGPEKSDEISTAVPSFSNELMDDDAESNTFYSRARECSGSASPDLQHLTDEKRSPKSKHRNAKLFFPPKYTVDDTTPTGMGKFQLAKDVCKLVKRRSFVSSLLGQPKETPTKHCIVSQSPSKGLPLSPARTEEYRPGVAADGDRTDSEDNRRAGRASRNRSLSSETASPKCKKVGLLQFIGLVVSPSKVSRREKECNQESQSSTKERDVKVDTNKVAEIPHLHAPENDTAARVDSKLDELASTLPTVSVPFPRRSDPGEALPPGTTPPMHSQDVGRGRGKAASARDVSSSQRSQPETRGESPPGSVRLASLLSLSRALIELQKLQCLAGTSRDGSVSRWSQSHPDGTSAVQMKEMKRRKERAEALVSRTALAAYATIKSSNSHEGDQGSQQISELQEGNKSSPTRLAINTDTNSIVKMRPPYFAELQEPSEEVEFNSEEGTFATFRDRDDEHTSAKNVFKPKSTTSPVEPDLSPKTETEIVRRSAPPNSGDDIPLLTTLRRQACRNVQPVGVGLLPQSESSRANTDSHHGLIAVEVTRSSVTTRWGNFSPTQNDADYTTKSRDVTSNKGKTEIGHRHMLAVVPQMDGSADHVGKESKAVCLAEDSSEQTGKSATHRKQNPEKADASESDTVPKSSVQKSLEGKTQHQPESEVTAETGRSSLTTGCGKEKARPESPLKKVDIFPRRSTRPVNMAKLKLSNQLALRRAGRESSEDTPPSSRYENVMGSASSPSTSSQQRRGGSSFCFPAGLSQGMNEMLGNVDHARQNKPPSAKGAEKAQRLNILRENSEEIRTPPQNKFLLVAEYWRETNISIEGKESHEEEDMAKDPAREYQELEDAPDIQRVKIHDWVPTPSHPRRPIPCPTILNSKARPNPEWGDMPTPGRPSTRRISKIQATCRVRYGPYVTHETLKTLAFNYYSLLESQERASSQSTVRKSLKDQLDSEASSSSMSSSPSSSLGEEGGSDTRVGMNKTRESSSYDTVFKKPSLDLFLKAKPRLRRQNNLEKLSREASHTGSSASLATSEPRLTINNRLVPFDVSGSPKPERSAPSVGLLENDDFETLASPLPKSTDIGEGFRQPPLPNLLKLKTMEKSSPKKGLLFVSANPAVVSEFMDESFGKRDDSKTEQAPKLKQTKIDSIFPNRPSKKHSAKPQDKLPSAPEGKPIQTSSTKLSTEDGNEEKEKDAKAQKQQSKSPFKVIHKWLSSSSRGKMKQEDSTEVKEERTKLWRGNKENVPTVSRNTEVEPRQSHLTQTGMRVVKTSTGVLQCESWEKPRVMTRKGLHLPDSSPVKVEHKFLKAKGALEDDSAC